MSCRRLPRLTRQRGQATIEWVGLVLLVALVLVGLTRVIPVGGRGLGVAVAERIGCAVRDGCSRGASRRPDRPPAAPPTQNAPEPRLGAVVPPVIPPEIARRFPRLARLAGLLGRKAWVACFGWESFRFDLENRARIDTTLSMSPKDAAGIANACLNPYSFFPG